MKNLIQYGSFLVAVGCDLNYDTTTVELEIAEYPEGKKDSIFKAVTDIQKFLNTANFQDGAAAFHLASFVDGKPNPVPRITRLAILNALGIMKGDRFVAPVMMQAKANRSWHTSEEPGQCTYFGEICTHRGILDDPKKRGIRSNRQPYEYHTAQGDSTKREQLITPAIEEAYDLIPRHVLVTAKPMSVVTAQVEKQIEKLDPEQLDELIRKLQEKRVSV